MGKVNMWVPGQTEGPIRLSEVLIASDFTQGTPVQIFMSNVSDSVIRKITISLDGEGSNHVAMARDENGEPGVWASAGESVIAYEGKLGSEEEVTFWARGVYDETDPEGTLPFEFVVETISGS